MSFSLVLDLISCCLVYHGPRGNWLYHMCMCVDTYVFICLCVHIFIYGHAYTYACICVHICVLCRHKCTNVYMCTMHVHMCMCVCMCTDTNAHSCIHICIANTYLCTRTSLCVYTYTFLCMYFQIAQVDSRLHHRGLCKYTICCLHNTDEIVLMVHLSGRVHIAQQHLSVDEWVRTQVFCNVEILDLTFGKMAWHDERHRQTLPLLLPLRGGVGLGGLSSADPHLPSTCTPTVLESTHVSYSTFWKDPLHPGMLWPLGAGCHLATGGQGQSGLNRAEEQRQAATPGSLVHSWVVRLAGASIGSGDHCA